MGAFVSLWRAATESWTTAFVAAVLMACLTPILLAALSAAPVWTVTLIILLALDCKH